MDGPGAHHYASHARKALKNSQDSLATHTILQN